MFFSPSADYVCPTANTHVGDCGSRRHSYWRQLFLLTTALVLVLVSTTLVSTSVVSTAYANDEKYYDRERDFGSWRDTDRDCLNTRHEVLLEESLIPATIEHCKVVKGLWLDNYSGEYFSDPRELDIDHVVPLYNTFINGSDKWSQEERVAYANDLDNSEVLIAVSAELNREKGAKSPDRWLPPNKDYWCQYIKDWVSIKNKYHLRTRKLEQAKIKEIMKSCDF